MSPKKTKQAESDSKLVAELKAFINKDAESSFIVLDKNDVKEILERLEKSK